MYVIYDKDQPELMLLRKRYRKFKCPWTSNLSEALVVDNVITAMSITHEFDGNVRFMSKDEALKFIFTKMFYGEKTFWINNNA